jgi:hypothetical protein
MGGGKKWVEEKCFYGREVFQWFLLLLLFADWQFSGMGLNASPDSNLMS